VDFSASGQTFSPKSSEMCKKRLTYALKQSKLAATFSRRTLANSDHVNIRMGNNMSLKQRKAFKALAVFLAFSFAQVYVQTSLAGSGSAGTPVPAPQRFVARLTLRGGPSATVNGASAATGASILTGATIETPDQVSGTIDLGAAGTIELQPNSSIQLDFDDNGNVRVRVMRGCVTIKKKGQGVGEIYTAEGASEKTNNNRKALGFCFLNGQLSSLSSAAATGGAVATGLSTAAKVAIFAGIAGGTTAIVLGTRGTNPSP